MMTTRRIGAPLLASALALSFFGPRAAARAQQVPTNQEPSLAEVARQQRQRPKIAKWKLTDEDIAHTKGHLAWGEWRGINPSITLSVYLPGEAPLAAYGYGVTLKSKRLLLVGFTSVDETGPDALDRAEEQLLGHGFGGIQFFAKRFLFDGNESVDGYPARVVHLTHRAVSGDSEATVVLVSLPQTVMAASCSYLMADKLEGQDICDKFASSLRLEIPNKYIVVEHRY